MVGVIVGSKKTGINPDNVATPIAASFGDLITLAILAWISQGLYKCLGTSSPLSRSPRREGARWARSQLRRELFWLPVWKPPHQCSPASSRGRPAQPQG